MQTQENQNIQELSKKLDGLMANLENLHQSIDIQSKINTLEVFTKNAKTEILNTLPNNANIKLEGKSELEKAKILKEQELNKICDGLIVRFKSDALGSPHFYDFKEEDQLNLMGLYNLKVDSFFRCQAEGKDYKENLPHTKKQLEKVAIDGGNNKTKAIFECGILKDYLRNLDSIDEVKKLNYDFLPTLKANLKIDENAYMASMKPEVLTSEIKPSITSPEPNSESPQPKDEKAKEQTQPKGDTQPKSQAEPKDTQPKASGGNNV
ncbi:hypothetical protein [Helicobacter sp. 11S02629-2]|uniref:hypothetical protein n=1 Tax=Helicobacter sp. 11S02629-2 TaxID=1476195 RepID=UPI000BA7B44A|nr:hypothetical protein [Helicobacter sp. 11S02629-2]PAF44173.1 hypothetical protein BKH40_06140 [Helicobacter sp. 11S02629-2]